VLQGLQENARDDELVSTFSFRKRKSASPLNPFFFKKEKCLDPKKKNLCSNYKAVVLHRFVKNHQSQMGGMFDSINLIQWFLSMLRDFPESGNWWLTPSVID